MLANPRIIARIDIKGSRLVKGIRFEGQRVYGNAGDYIKKYYEESADEILLIDTVASLYERNSLDDIIDFSTKNSFIPATVEGGIRNISDARNILLRGADKVAVNSGAIENKILIKELSTEFGSQSIVSSIQAKKRSESNWEAFCLNGRHATGIDVLSWAKEVQSLGAGEILLSSVDCDGVGKGMDFELIKKISNNVDIPVIASSGASSIEEIKFILKNTNISGIAIGKLLHEKILSIQNIKKALDL